METSISQLYEDIVGVVAPWVVTAVIKDDGERKITIRIEYGRDAPLVCPVCGQNAKLYDCIQRIKRMAYGFRNKERFKTAILFHLGNLNMDPSTI